MRLKTHLLGYVLLLIGCLFVSGDLLAQDTALVYVIDIRNEIGSGLGTYISDGIKLAEEAGADAIVFDVDTPGGRVDSAVNIIRSIQNTQIPTIAFVNRQAISAGAMISIACNQIVMTSGGTIGDSAPVNIQGDEVGEKAVSYIQGTIRATAERENRNPDIAEAMVDKELLNSEMGKLSSSSRKNTRREKKKVRRWKSSARKENCSPCPPGRHLNIGSPTRKQKPSLNYWHSTRLLKLLELRCL
ncbi:hypothetical protein F4Z99_08790 [Candidatus Poribacteria bacterium]|nr:hypothetical protein [Candidatus Poribacteria bacterium]